MSTNYHVYNNDNTKCDIVIHNVYENLILNQRCSQKYNNNENSHVDIMK